MKTEIYPHQYFALKKQVDDLINVYQSVSDLKTVATMQSLIFERIDQIFPEKFAEIEALKEFILDKTLSKAKAQAYLEDLRPSLFPLKRLAISKLRRFFAKSKNCMCQFWISWI